ncbi:thiol:disulfide interchange protein [Defluviimonas sp. 20V17]|uniref:Thiol:disulfide interchange protein DsbD n=1 Tax=Allgaiera indica TaxID=765699 RepID=A0AAN4UT96_9RHOB|nr:protein-disulfide reductase DsbD [Allgaiera indica]KDB04628.1 thiol:disulfide interchange protein [Defluviimonas sp. 20V17]GHE03706.1 thiol:disulfide interchange protein DsbD [Allgaiera indica]SDX74141.1 thiol:disulfide interchange protein DsbD [Allgaiera indica]
MTHHHFLRLARLALLWLLLATPLAAQSPINFLSSGSARPLLPGEAFAVTTQREPDGSLKVHLGVAKGYHLYRDRLKATTASGTPLQVESPPGVIDDDPNFGRVEIWRKPVTARVLSQGGAVILTWQGCEEAGVCYPPQSRTIPAMAGFAQDTPPGPLTGQTAAQGTGQPGGQTTGQTAGQTGAQTPAAAATQTATPGASGAAAIPATAPAAPAPALTLDSQSGLVTGLMARGGATLVILAFFGFGILLAFTPCVLPMVPVVMGMLAARGTKLTPGRGAALTGAYVLAVALAFAALGLVAAWSGSNLQVALQTPAVIWSVAALFVLLALGAFGLFELRMPDAIARRLSGPARGRGTLPGAFGLGLTSALVIGPCVTAPLAGALLYIAQTGDAAFGAAALFALGLGQGVPLMAVGIFGSAILPRLGPWMTRIREVFGFVFLGMAIWIAGRVLPGPTVLALWAVLLIVAGVFLGALDRLPPRSGPARKLSTAAGLVVLLLGALQGIGAASGSADGWQPLARLVGTGSAAGAATAPGAASASTEAAARMVEPSVSSPDELRQALARVKGPALVYVTADWCTSCQEIEHKVLPQPAVQAALRQVTSIKVDVTRFGPDDQALLNQLGAVGPPTYVFLDAGHKEVPGTRLVGEFGAAQLIASLNKTAR